ncbi:hypothetical protein V7793_03310 [Streptomyces sp. KLMMK]|uniref:hypothetical protein n=1 Tax=Streptomyces sp. KLMMK TaxID=3109353 RepID=UPI002FFE4FEF
MRLEAAVAALTLGRSAINTIRRAVAAAAAGVLLTIGSVAMATPAHADNEGAKLYCALVRALYDQAQFIGCQNLE